MLFSFCARLNWITLPRITVNVKTTIINGPRCNFYYSPIYLLADFDNRKYFRTFQNNWKSNVSIILKLLVVGLLAGLLILVLYKFDSVETGNVTISRWEIMIYSASLLIGLNWSINLSSKSGFQRINVPKYLKLTAMTIAFAILIPTIFYLSVNFFDKLNCTSGANSKV